jgi:hypothetical protein
LATLTTRSSVGDTKYFSMMSLNTSPVHMSHIYITLLIFTAYATISSGSQACETVIYVRKPQT